MATRWVLIGAWPEGAPDKAIDADLAHAWTGEWGVACHREDYGLVRYADSQPRCAVCVAWATGDPLPTPERTT